jgi:ribonuclease-3
MTEDLGSLQDRLGHRFRDPSLLVLAMKHASSRGKQEGSNERLEFLGDSVLGLVVCQYLFERSTDTTEGQMTKVKSSVVSRSALARAGRWLELAEHLQVDEGLRQRRHLPVSLLADAYEALVGAIYLDAGLATARDFVLRTLAAEIEAAEADKHVPSYKSTLQELAQADGSGVPRYKLVRHEGPDHRRRYLCAVRVGEEDWGAGWGTTKKAAEQQAARDALRQHYPGLLADDQ